MANDYENDRALADKHINQIRQILGPYIIDIASFEQDARQATDLIVLTKNNLTIGCRIRREGVAVKYGPDDFTIRWSRNSGAETEIAKIRKGWGQWFFYSHLVGNAIAGWMLLNLDIFRQGEPAAHPIIKPNTDGTSLAAYNTAEFPAPLVIARYWNDALIRTTMPAKKRQPVSREERLVLARKAVQGSL